MASKKKPTALLLFLTVLLFTLFITSCSSMKAAPDVPLVVEEPLPEPTLADLAAALDATWSVAPSTGPLFSASIALPAGDRLARKSGTALGGFLADAERGFLSEYGIETDFAFLNAELIRAGLPEGPVTKQDIERVLPFGQKIVVAEMSGSQLLELFSFIGALPQGAGGFAQISDGVSYTLTFDETGFGAEISNLLVGGKPVDVLRTYRVAVNDFVAAGGNGYSFFLREDVMKVQTVVKLADAVADYCSSHADSLYMKQGERITIQGGIAE